MCLKLINGKCSDIQLVYFKTNIKFNTLTYARSGCADGTIKTASSSYEVQIVWSYNLLKNLITFQVVEDTSFFEMI